MKVLTILVLFIGLAITGGCSSDNNNSGGDKDGGGNGGDGTATTISGKVNLAGTWRGAAVVVIPGHTINCDALEYRIQQTTTEIEIVGGELVCNGGTNTLDPMTVTIQGNQILENGNVIGSISQDTLTLLDQAGPSTYKRSGNQLQVNEVFPADTGGTGSITATLTRQ